MLLTNEAKAKELADALDRAERTGTARDVPEGSRYITISDTLAIRMAEDLRRLADALR